MTFKGYGEEFPINECVDNVWCNDEKHAKNRRIDFNINNISYQVNFQKNSSVISHKDKLVLNNILLILKSEENLKVEIGVIIDKGTGDDFINDNISTLRAQKVFNYLKNNGLDMANITYVGYGSRSEKFGDERDRRIEFKILKDE